MTARDLIVIEPLQIARAEDFGEPAKPITPCGGVGDAGIAPGGEVERGLGRLAHPHRRRPASRRQRGGRRATPPVRAPSISRPACSPASASGVYADASCIGDRITAGGEVALVGVDGVADRCRTTGIGIAAARHACGPSRSPATSRERSQRRCPRNRRRAPTLLVQLPPLPSATRTTHVPAAWLRR